MKKESQILTSGRCLIKVRDILEGRHRLLTKPGIYAWWFSKRPGIAPTRSAKRVGEYWLLYVGTAPANLRSKSTLQTRLNDHVYGPISKSTLRRTLAALLKSELKLQAVKTPNGRLKLDGDGEFRLTDWIRRHAAVSYVAINAPWEVERSILSSKRIFPLNIQDTKHSFLNDLKSLRRKFKSSARLI